jgi:hypothetical protein
LISSLSVERLFIPYTVALSALAPVPDLLRLAWVLLDEQTAPDAVLCSSTRIMSGLWSSETQMPVDHFKSPGQSRTTVGCSSFTLATTLCASLMQSGTAANKERIGGLDHPHMMQLAVPKQNSCQKRVVELDAKARERIGSRFPISSKALTTAKVISY